MHFWKILAIYIYLVSLLHSSQSLYIIHIHSHMCLMSLQERDISQILLEQNTS